MLELHVSCGEGIEVSELVRFLCDRGIECTANATLSAVKVRRDGTQIMAGVPVSAQQGGQRSASRAPLKVEAGLRILLHCSGSEFSNIWPEMKRHFGLGCGHISERSLGFSGCTENFVRESLCPMREIPKNKMTI
jgi:hypothetical protein